MLMQTAVITAGGLGIRLLPQTKSIPKEMLPLRVKEGNYFRLKPISQLIFEQLYKFGIKEFCFVLNKDKKVMQDHFSISEEIETRAMGKYEQYIDLVSFHEMIRGSIISFSIQREPLGFGDALLYARGFTRGEPFILNAGDTYIPDSRHIERMNSVWKKYKPSALFVYNETNNNWSGKGIIMGKPYDEDILLVQKVIEKPKEFISRKAVIAQYMFAPEIYKAVAMSKRENGEKQVTTGIQSLIDSNLDVLAIPYKKAVVDVGTYNEYAEWITKVIDVI